MSFQFDTSGVVDAPAGSYLTLDGQKFLALGFGALSPFVQGYVEMMFREAFEASPMGEGLGPSFDGIPVFAFSDLAAETLSRIIEDCERVCSHLPTQYASFWGVRPEPFDQERNGRLFWKDRQSGLRKNFPPLTLTLGEDGKVRFA